MTIELLLFGAFRDWFGAPSLEIEIADGARIADLRRLLQAQWSAREAGLLAASAFASETTVLRDADPLPADAPIALLPPVSGG